MKKGAGAAPRLRKGSRCPTCRAGKLIPIVYGLPGRELVAQYDRGEIELGGCVVGTVLDSSHWETESELEVLAPELSCPNCDAKHRRRSGSGS